MRRTAIFVILLALAGCGSSGLEGVLVWDGNPVVNSSGSAAGNIRNTTSHSLDLHPNAMRLLDDRGRKVAGKVHVARDVLAAHAVTALRATWKSGKPVRIDYGAGTLPLPSD